MSQRFLPPLEADTSYRVADFEWFEYSGRSLMRPLAGEDTNILRLHLKNRTTLDLPATDEALHHLLRNLIHAFPVVALDEIKSQPWSRGHLPEDDG